MATPSYTARRQPPGALPPTARPTGRTPGALLSDEPAATEDDDLLGAWDAAGRLAALLLESRGSTPFTLAVDAGWGMGKSTLMRLVERRLEEAPGVHTVWYNAWSSSGADALEGLIKSVLARLDRNVLRRALRRARAASPAARQAVRVLSLLAAGPLGVAGLVDQLWKSLSVDPATRNGMRDALRVLVAEWADAAPPGAPGRLLVVFVDDLDRCSQQTVLALCEALKVYLDVPGLAFVVGCDAAALDTDGMLRGLDPAGAAFMEKILQTSYRIPVAGRDRIHRYVLACAERAGLELMLDEPLVELLAYRASRNPRRVKRLVNGLLLEARLNPVWRNVGLDAAVLTLLLRFLYSDFHRLMTTPGWVGPWSDAVREFQEYTAVLPYLASADVWEPATVELVARFARRYAVPPPATAAPGPARHATLDALEDQLPAGFPALARDPAFTTLLGELIRRPDAARVLRLLREGPEPDPGRSAATTRPGYQDVLGHPSDHGFPPVGPAFGYPQSGHGGGAGPDGLPQPAGYQGPAWPSGVRGGVGPAPVGGPGGRSGPGWPEQEREWEAVAEAGREPGASVGSGAGPSVSPALDPDDPDTYPAGAPDWYAQPTPYPLRRSGFREAAAGAPGGQAGQPRPTVLVAGFDSVEAPRLASELRRGGVEARYAYNDWVWRTALAAAPSAVLCHSGGFGRPDGFALVRAAREGGYTGPAALYTPRLTPSALREAERLRDVEIHDDAGAAAAALVQRLTPAAPGGPTTGGTGGSGGDGGSGGYGPRLNLPPGGGPGLAGPGSGLPPDAPGSA